MRCRRTMADEMESVRSSGRAGGGATLTPAALMQALRQTHRSHFFARPLLFVDRVARNCHASCPISWRRVCWPACRRKRARSAGMTMLSLPLAIAAIILPMPGIFPAADSAWRGVAGRGAACAAALLGRAAATAQIKSAKFLSPVLSGENLRLDYLSTRLACIGSS